MEKTKTGITNFDKMMHGGMMTGDVTLVAGSPGTGKTTLGMQFIYNGAMKYNEPGLFVTFEELPAQLYRDAKGMGMDLKAAEEKGKIKVLCTTADVLQRMRSDSKYLDNLIDDMKIKRVFVDSLSLFEKMTQQRVEGSVYFTTHDKHKETELRNELYSFVNYFKTRGVTTIMSYELPSVLDTQLTLSKFGAGFVVDAVIVLREVELESEIVKAIAILKVRGTDYDNKIRRFKITKEGIKIGLPFRGYSGIIGRAAIKL
jgi:circadian clock protein KaiC